MPPAELFPDLEPTPSKVDARAREDVLTAELIEYCSRFGLPTVLPDTIEAGDAWGANCGPMSLAAVLGLPTVEAVRPLVQPFRGFMSPTNMVEALKRAWGIPERWANMGHQPNDPWPRLGLVRIQWVGPWCAPGVNPRAAYRHTHWIGARDVLGAVEVYDCTPNRWIPLERWERWCETLWPKRATGWAPVTRIDVALPTGPNGQVR
jgi:hypothetical protein